MAVVVDISADIVVDFVADIVVDFVADIVVDTDIDMPVGRLGIAWKPYCCSIPCQRCSEPYHLLFLELAPPVFEIRKLIDLVGILVAQSRIRKRFHLLQRHCSLGRRKSNEGCWQRCRRPSLVALQSGAGIP